MIINHSHNHMWSPEHLERPCGDMGPCAMVAGSAEPLVQKSVDERHVPYHLHMRAKDHDPKHIHCMPQSLAWKRHPLVGSLASYAQSDGAMPVGNVYKMVLGMTTGT